MIKTGVEVSSDIETGYTASTSYLELTMERQAGDESICTCETDAKIRQMLLLQILTWKCTSSRENHYTLDL